MSTSLVIVPLELRDLNAFVALHHRHHDWVQGHRFSIGCIDTNTDTLVGGASIGRPVSRGYNPRTTLEVTRLVSNGFPNACSFLYGAAARIGKEMGYKRIQSYILDNESGKTLKASGWFLEGMTPGGQWVRSDLVINRTNQPINPKQRWVRILQTHQFVMEES